MENEYNTIEEEIKLFIADYHQNNYSNKKIDIYKILNQQQQSLLEEFRIILEKRSYSYEECILIKMIVLANAALRNKFKDESTEIINLLSKAIES